MGLPEVKITFQENVNNFIRRLGRGIVAVPVVDSTLETVKVVEAAALKNIKKAVKDLPQEKQEDAQKKLTTILNAGAKKALLIYGKDASAIQGALESLRFNWLAIGEATDDEQAAFAKWAKGIEFTAGRTFIVVGSEKLAKEKDGHVVALEKTATTNEKVTSVLIAGVFAGLSDRSGTYFVIDTDTDGAGYATRVQAEAAVNKGLLTVFYDGEKAKIGRAVTTVYVSDAVSAYAKIRNVDAMNMIVDDIKDSFNEQYVGQVLNSYANKMNFIGQLNQVYLKGLEGQVLDPNAVNKVDLDVERHAELATEAGLDVSEMTKQQLREYNTGAAVYLSGKIKMLDSIEDLYISFTI